eukprot:4149759-Pleurochrysis_carterae.AAC.1
MPLNPICFRRVQGATNAKALAHREAREMAESLLTIMKATSQGRKFKQWPLEKCASLANTTDTRELLISTETQTHLLIEWQCLNLRDSEGICRRSLGR